MPQRHDWLGSQFFQSVSAEPNSPWRRINPYFKQSAFCTWAKRLHDAECSVPGCGRTGNRLDYLRRQSKAHVFRHDFDFLDIVESLRAQELDDFFDQTLRRRSSGSQCDGLHAFQPLWLNVLTTVDQV